MITLLVICEDPVIFRNLIGPLYLIYKLVIQNKDLQENQNPTGILVLGDATLFPKAMQQSKDTPVVLVHTGAPKYKITNQKLKILLPRESNVETIKEAFKALDL